MVFHTLAHLLIVSIFSLTALTFPHEKRQVNETDILEGYVSFDDRVDRQIDLLRFIRPTAQRIRRIIVEPRMESASAIVTHMTSITIELFDVADNKFYYTTNDGTKATLWSDVTESDFQDWDDLEYWYWAEKSSNLKTQMKAQKARGPRINFESIALEKPVADWSENQQLWWFFVPEDDGTTFWQGDRDGEVVRDDDPAKKRRHPDAPDKPDTPSQKPRPADRPSRTLEGSSVARPTGLATIVPMNGAGVSSLANTSLIEIS